MSQKQSLSILVIYAERLNEAAVTVTFHCWRIGNVRKYNKGCFDQSVPSAISKNLMCLQVMKKSGDLIFISGDMTQATSEITSGRLDRKPLGWVSPFKTSLNKTLKITPPPLVFQFCVPVPLKPLIVTGPLQCTCLFLLNH